MEVEVAIPDGCYPGDIFTVSTADGQELDVEVPDGCEPGTLLTVALPQPAGAESQVEVGVPDGCYPGMEFTVEFDGREFNVTVPDGCMPGDLILVEENAAPATNNDRKFRPSVVSSTYTYSSGGAPSSSSLEQEASAPPGEKKKSKGLNLALNLGGGLSLNLALCTQGKFKINSQVEVLRSDGYWSRATVMEYDWRGGNYTVMLPDGRNKYFVEEEDLRPPEKPTS